MPLRRRLQSGFVPVLAAALAAGCAGAARPAEVTPEALAALEAERTLRPGDPEVVTRVGVAYYQAGRLELARDVLAMALTFDHPAAFTAAVHLGLAQEGLGDLGAARQAYEQASRMRVSGAQRREVEQRLTLLGRLELAADARRAVEAEARFGAGAPQPNTIAVLPFRYLGDNDELRPIEHGLTHLVVSDLAKVARLTVLERERVQAVLDELALAEQGAVDPATAARSGRILRAERVVHGVVRSIDGEEGVAIDAQVVGGAGEVTAAGSGSDRLQRLLDLQKAVVFDLLDQLGIVPTPAERRAIGERPTADLQAFLAFSRGLEAEARGDLAAARRHFGAAAGRDAGFGAALDRIAEVQRLSLALRTTPDRLAVAARAPGAADGAAIRTTRADALGTAVASVAPSIGDQLARRTSDPRGTPDRARVQEGLNRDDPTLIGLVGTIIIVVPRP